MPPKGKRRRPRVVVDTSALVAGISGLREPFVQGRNPSADVLHKWAEKDHFVWLVTEDILDEYKEVLKRHHARPNLIGRVVNLIRERAEEIKVRPSMEISPDPKDDPFCLCAEQGKADFIVTLNPKDFPEDTLDMRNYDRSGRLNAESFCLDPDTSRDPLADYYGSGLFGFMGGGLGGEHILDQTP